MATARLKVEIAPVSSGSSKASEFNHQTGSTITKLVNQALNGPLEIDVTLTDTHLFYVLEYMTKAQSGSDMTAANNAIEGT